MISKDCFLYSYEVNVKKIKITKLNCSSVIVKNLVFRQKATMSSIYHTSNGPERAVDGIYGQACVGIAVHSGEQTSSQWLRIEFGGWKHAGFVEIHNPHTTNIGVMQRLSNSFLYVYGENPTDNRQICAEIVDGGNRILNLPCVKTLYGKGIELYLPYKGQPRILHICEIIVLGY